VAHYKNQKPRDKKKSVDEIDSSRFWDVPFLGGGALPPKIPTLSLVPQSNIISTLNKLFTPNKENIIYILIIYMECNRFLTLIFIALCSRNYHSPWRHTPGANMQIQQSRKATLTAFLIFLASR
jgi:hypothetical protein